MTAAERGYVNISEAATLLGVNRATIWRWIRAGRLPVTRLGHRTVRIRTSDLEQLLVQHGSDRGWPQPWHAGASALSDHWPHVAAGQHVVHFYERDGYLLDALHDFIGAGLHAGEPGIVVLTSSHRVGLEERLAAAGIDVATVSAAGRYLALDAEEMLGHFMVAGMPDPDRFRALFAPVIEHALTGGRTVRVFGEMVALLAAGDKPSSALALEALWNDLQQELPFALFCAYPLDGLGGPALANLLHDVCTAHTHVIAGESYSALDADDERHREVIALQQKARRLEAEIAERRRAEARLRGALEAEQAARTEAEAALRVRDEFLSVAAHELKTPLTGLAGHAQFLQRQFQRNRSVDPARVGSALETIGAQAQKLSRLVNELLDVSRLEAGKLVLVRQPVDLAVLLREVITSLAIDGTRHPLNLHVPTVLLANVDALRIEQLSTNLLDNAIKFSPHGGAIDVVAGPTDGATVELSVRDRGLGIPDESQERIFERFYQAGSVSQATGLGLGLHICRQIAHLHGGDITVEAPAGGGTRFVVRLPDSLVQTADAAADD
jgi:excisionase family DNA binding protein